MRINIYITIVFFIFIIIFYKESESIIIIKEMYNSVSTLKQLKIEEKYYISNGIYSIFIHKYDIEYIQKIINMDYVKNNAKIHKSTMYILLIVLSIITTIYTITKKRNILLYQHEKEKIKKNVYTTIIFLTITTLIFIEITTSILIKKNINTTEMLYTYNMENTKIDVLLLLISIAMYVWYTKMLNKRIAEPKYKNETKSMYIIIYVLIINSMAQYSIYESLILLGIAETIVQLNALQNRNEIT